MDLCWDCGKRLKNPIRKYCAKCWDKRLVEREKREAKEIEKIKEMNK
ncbi:MAG: hypothetical protein HWN68_13850 [Desulfobacterales bacterium]|nr:hypothetical protein [Desulfobacterales bacterium]